MQANYKSGTDRRPTRGIHYKIHVNRCTQGNFSYITIQTLTYVFKTRQLGKI